MKKTYSFRRLVISIILGGCFFFSSLSTAQAQGFRFINRCAARVHNFRRMLGYHRGPTIPFYSQGLPQSTIPNAVVREGTSSYPVPFERSSCSMPHRWWMWMMEGSAIPLLNDRYQDKGVRAAPFAFFPLLDTEMLLAQQLTMTTLLLDNYVRALHEMKWDDAGVWVREHQHLEELQIECLVNSGTTCYVQLKKEYGGGIFYPSGVWAPGSKIFRVNQFTADVLDALDFIVPGYDAPLEMQVIRRRSWMGVLFAKKSKKSGKEKANDVPDWVKEHKPRRGEDGKAFAKRVLEEKYGKDKEGKPRKKWPLEWPKIQKWVDRKRK